MRLAIPSREASRIEQGDRIVVPLDGIPTWLDVLDMRPSLEKRWLVVEVPSGVRVGEIVELERRLG